MLTNGRDVASEEEDMQKKRGMETLKKTTPLVYFDLETTGLYRSPKKWSGAPDEIVQICAFVVREKKRVAEFTSHCKPSVRDNFRGLRPSKAGARPTAYDIHRISEKDVDGAKTWKDVGKEFRTFVHRHTHGCSAIFLVAYNGWAFDGQFLVANNTFHGVPGFKKPVFVCDPLQVVAGFVQRGRRRQEDVYKRLFGEEMSGAAHDARNDVKALVRICGHPSIAAHMPSKCKAFPQLFDCLSRKTITTVDGPCEECGRVCSKYFDHDCESNA